MKKIILGTILASALFFTGCREEEELRDESVIYLTEINENDFDKWLYEKFTKPYNIEVKYKWDDSEIDNNFHVTPPKTEKAKDYMEALFKIWIEPYEAEGGTEFIKTYVPKLFYLVGTPNYNNDGTITLGLAEGGRKVTVFDVDAFDKTDLDAMTKSFHTLHHEFAHILHQKVLYPNQFKELSKGYYTGSWQQYNDPSANLIGFISAYSMLNDAEDWVELVAYFLSNVKYANDKHLYKIPVKDANGYIIEGETMEVELTEFEYNLWMVGIQITGWGSNKKYEQHPYSPSGLALLLQKYSMVETYYHEVWGIDLANLQKRIEQATNTLIDEEIE